LRPLKASKPWDEKPGKRLDRFVDWRRTKVHGGNGGNGCVSTLSVYKEEFAGPDGGDGGNGAHVLFR